MALPADLAPAPEERVRQHAGDHGLADRDGANADARIVATLGDDLRILESAGDGEAGDELAVDRRAPAGGRAFGDDFDDGADRGALLANGAEIVGKAIGGPRVGARRPGQTALSKFHDCANVGRGTWVPGRSVRISVAILLAPLAAVLAAGCQNARPEADQIAQQRMIGLSKRDVLACLGRPARRAAAGEATEIWTYAGGPTRGYGPQWAIGLNTNLSPFARPGACEVRMVVTHGRVSQIGYAAGDGGALPLGQECLFPVERCVLAP